MHFTGSHDEKFLGQMGAKKWHCIDIGDVSAVPKTVNPQNFLKIDLLPAGNNEPGCTICMDSVDDDSTRYTKSS